MWSGRRSRFCRRRGRWGRRRLTCLRLDLHQAHGAVCLDLWLEVRLGGNDGSRRGRLWRSTAGNRWPRRSGRRCGRWRAIGRCRSRRSSWIETEIFQRVATHRIRTEQRRGRRWWGCRWCGGCRWRAGRPKHPAWGRTNAQAGGCQHVHPCLRIVDRPLTESLLSARDHAAPDRSDHARDRGPYRSRVLIDLDGEIREAMLSWCRLERQRGRWLRRSDIPASVVWLWRRRRGCFLGCPRWRDRCGGRFLLRRRCGDGLLALPNRVPVE